MMLDKIVKNKEREIKANKKNMPLRSFKPKLKRSKRNFKRALSAKGLNLIAEIKRKSPSKGLIRKGLNPMKLAKEYELNNASAISVLTDKKYFGGTLHDLQHARLVTKIPLLRKDFIIDRYQIHESRYCGADAVLLIAGILTLEQIKEFIRLAGKYKMDCLVEVHNERELKKALKAGAEIIGINNRNLDTLKINLNTTLKLAKKIPKGRIIVSESGFIKKKDVGKVRGKVNAVLIGTSLVESKDVKSKIRELLE